jgi:hypothetical protein
MKCGNLNEAFLEFNSIVVGVELRLQDLFTTAEGNVAASSAATFEAWKVEWAKDSFAQQQILQLLDSHSTVLKVWVAMRSGSVPLLQSAIGDCTEHAAVTNGYKYLTMLHDVTLHLRTCPDRHLMCMPKLMFVDLGVMFSGVDYLTETLNLWFERQVGGFVHEAQYHAAMRLAASNLRHHPRAGRLGLPSNTRKRYGGLADAPVALDIAKTVYDVMVESKIGDVLAPTVPGQEMQLAPMFIDTSGNTHPRADLKEGVNAGATCYSLAGTKHTADQVSRHICAPRTPSMVCVDHISTYPHPPAASTNVLIPR